MQLDHMSDGEIFALANPIMDNLMEASTAIDHERHIRDFSDRMKSIVTKEYFQKVCEKLSAGKRLLRGAGADRGVQTAGRGRDCLEATVYKGPRRVCGRDVAGGERG